MATIQKPIIQIRTVIKDLHFDARDENLPQKVLKRFIHCVESVTDIRFQATLTYPLPYILLLAFLAVLSGADTWVDIQTFSESYKTKLNGILPRFKSIAVPSHDTFQRVFGLLKIEEMQAATATFLIDEIEQLKKELGIEETGPRILCLDGKEQKGTGRKYNTDQKIRNLQTMHCYDASNGICLFSVPINSKTNEIPTAQEMLRLFQLKNCIVTFDAMNTQRDTIAVITKNGGDYVGGLKGNQHLFYEEAENYFSETELIYIRLKGENYRTYIEKAHNQIETRAYYMSTDLQWYSDLGLWNKLKSVTCCETKTEDLVTGKLKIERRYYISSLTDLELISDAIRSHWSIENQLHWHLDVTFAEDDNTTMDQSAFNNLSTLNKMALTLLKLIQPAFKHKISLKTIRKKFGWDFIQQLTLMLTILDEEAIAEAMQKLISKPKSSATFDNKALNGQGGSLPILHSWIMAILAFALNF